MRDDRGSASSGRVGAVRGIAFTGIGKRLVIRIRHYRISNVRSVSWRTTDVAVTLEDFFGCNIGCVIE